MSNNVAYQIRVRKAAQQLSGVGSPTMRQFRYRNNSGGTLGACNCAHSAPRSGGSPRLRAVRVQKLGGYKLVTGVRAGLSGVGMVGMVEKPVAALIPVSDKKAVSAAVKLFVNARTSGMHGYRLGATAQVQGAAAGAATGAEVGSIIPVVGTVIGAVVGAVVGWLGAKSKPVRASAAEVAQCRGDLTEYMGYAAQLPNEPLPMEWNQILGLNWCYEAVYGGEVALKDPRWFNQGFEAIIKPAAIDIVKKIYETPVGGTVNLGSINARDSKGKPMTFPGFSFVNPVFTNLKNIANQFFVPATSVVCGANAGKGAGGCITHVERAEWRRLMYDLLCWAARTTLPNISEADLRAASQVAATIPNTSAKDVVSAVEMILNRPVVREETAALLTPAAAMPGQAAPAPQIPQTAIAPLIPVVQANPIDTTTALPAALPSRMPVPGASAGGSGYATLPSQTSAPTQLAPIAAGLPGGNSVWIAGGLGVLAVLFATARPMKGRR